MLSTSETIGSLDRKILIEEPIVLTDSDSNQYKTTGWQEIENNGQPRAKVEEKSGTEVMQTDQITGVKFTTFTIRYRTDLDLKYRIVYGGWTYNIQSILEIGRKRYLRITCEGGGQYKETET